MKKVLIAIASLAVVACSDPIPQDQWVRGRTDMTQVKGFEDCIFTSIQTKTNSNPINIVRCPNSSTATNWTVQSGKSTTTLHSVTVDSGMTSRIQQLEEQIATQNAQIREQQETISRTLNALKAR